MQNTPRVCIRRPAMSPCFGCQVRAVGCHAGCEAYQAYKKSNDADYQKMVATYKGEYIAEMYEVKSKMRTINRQKGRKQGFGYEG